MASASAREWHVVVVVVSVWAAAVESEGDLRFRTRLLGVDGAAGSLCVEGMID
jgi:hypothetical protein